MTTHAVEISQVGYRYPQRAALVDVSLQIAQGEIFVLLGPNGGGKTTLFRLAATLMPLQSGEIRLLGYDVRRQTAAARAAIGVVFQAPSVDKKLSVAENLRHQGYLYGLSGRRLAQRQAEMLARLGLSDRAGDRVETLSGGLRRRVELAKGMLHEPRLLLMDEPSTGLDPAARADVWACLRQMRAQGVTIVLTTHLLEEADRADRLAILNQGSVVALDTPERLRATLGGDSLTIATPRPDAVQSQLHDRFGLASQQLDGRVRLQHADIHRLIPAIRESLADDIDSLALGKPSLEDVFIARTGRRFWQTADDGEGADE